MLRCTVRGPAFIAVRLQEPLAVQRGGVHMPWCPRDDAGLCAMTQRGDRSEAFFRRSYIALSYYLRFPTDPRKSTTADMAYPWY